MSFFKILFRAWENSPILFFNHIDVIFATLVKFSVGFYTSHVFLLKPTLIHILLMLIRIEFNSRFMLLTNCILRFYIFIYVVCLHSMSFIYIVTIYISNCITMLVYLILDSCWLHLFIFCVFWLVSFALILCFYSEILS